MDEELAYHLRRERFAACFRKPFEPDQIVAIIETALEQPACTLGLAIAVYLETEKDAV